MTVLLDPIERLDPIDQLMDKYGVPASEAFKFAAFYIAVGEAPVGFRNPRIEALETVVAPCICKSHLTVAASTQQHGGIRRVPIGAQNK